MPIPTPFHERTAPLCTSHLWKEWAGYLAVRSFDTCHEPEYIAFRHACGLLDVSPLYKYRVTGHDAGRFLARVVCRDVRRLRPGRVTYTTWCDEDGKVLDDGTVTRLEDAVWRVTSAEPALAWFTRHARGFDVQVEDVSATLAALSLQGPTSREALAAAAGAAVRPLRFFGHLHATIAGRPVDVTRTGYTGDLGYEVWVDRADALAVWDALVEAGAPHGLLPAGLDALDMTRVEAGFVLQGVDYVSARAALIEAQSSTPAELDLDWTVDLDRDPFIGQDALRAEAERGRRHAFVALDVDWDELVLLYRAKGLPPAIPAAAWREARPVYAGRQQVGRATSGTFSPTLKRNLALATVEARYAALGTRLAIEATVEYERHRVTATVCPKPPFDPERKRA